MSALVRSRCSRSLLVSLSFATRSLSLSILARSRLALVLALDSLLLAHEHAHEHVPIKSVHACVPKKRSSVPYRRPPVPTPVSTLAYLYRLRFSLALSLLGRFSLSLSPLVRSSSALVLAPSFALAPRALTLSLARAVRSLLVRVSNIPLWTPETHSHSLDTQCHRSFTELSSTMITQTNPISDH